MTRDKYLTAVISPAKPDEDEIGLVKSVAFKPVENLGTRMAWMPNRSLLMMDSVNKKGQTEVINWEKNGLIRNSFVVEPFVNNKDGKPSEFKI